ncbi:universal stress protein [Halalkalicoccus ordinarius]|uniref:universal stress protein n=1 Tax=Halalkalicoccus ordinarius TaxID=3116651 RepID=UPI00300EA798
MTRRVLVAMTQSEESERAVEHAVSTFPDAEITVLHVINPNTYYGAEGEMSYRHVVETGEERAEELFEIATEIAERHGASIATETAFGNARHEILAYAKEHDVDQIVMGSRGRSGISRALLGSVAEAVTRRSPVPVTVVK